MTPKKTVIHFTIVNPDSGVERRRPICNTNNMNAIKTKEWSVVTCGNCLKLRRTRFM